MGKQGHVTQQSFKPTSMFIYLQLMLGLPGKK